LGEYTLSPVGPIRLGGNRRFPQGEHCAVEIAAGAVDA
jgi:hypothetical protein